MRKKLLSFLLAMLCLIVAGKAQVLSISGRVEDEKGAPIPFVSVVLKNKNSSGTTSDQQGNFKISASKGDVLVFTGVGYATREVAIGNNTKIEVRLLPGKTDLSEVVVTAMGIRKTERALGYAVSKVDPSTMLQKSEPNVLNTLAGKVPGVDIRAGQGAPGAASRIQIRGVSSFSGGDPLIVVDGVPYSNPIVNTTSPFSAGGTYGSGINNIDPNDIESISVLKGAAAASLYGSRASGGVLLITTKSGSPKKGAKSLNVSYRAGYAIEKVANIPEFQNLYGAGANFRTQGSNGSWGAKFGKGVIYDGNGQVIGQSASGVDSIPAITWLTMRNAYPELFPNDRAPYKAYPNNVKDLFTTGNMMEHSVSVNGGEGKSLFSLTLSHLDQDGYITNSSYRKSNVSIGGQTAIGNLTIGGNASYARSKQVGGYIGAAQSFVSQWGRTYTMARNWDIVGYPSVNKSGQQIGFNDGQYINPVWAAYHNTITSFDDRMVANLRASYKFNNWIRADLNAGVNNYALYRDQIIDKSSYGPADNPVGNMTEVVNRQQEINGKFLVAMNPKVAEDFTLDINVGVDINERNTRNQQVYGADFVIPGLFTITNTRRQRFDSDRRTKRRLVGIFADASLGYKNYAFINLVGRTDLTSTLPYANAQYFYPGISGSLVWSEAFNLKNEWFDYGKVRVGYARVGNDAAPHNQDPVFNLSAAGFLGQPTSTRGGTTYDPNLTPEFTTELEIGTDARFLHNRVGFEVTWYDKRSTDLIYAINLPWTTGYNQFFTNLGEIRNTGWEVALDVTPVRTKNLEWNIRGVYTQNKNTVLSLVEGLTRDQLGGYNWIEPGKPYGFLRGSYSARSEDGQLLISPISGIPLVDPNDGMVGDPNADFKMGLTNTVSFKGFTLNVLFDWTQGGDFYSETIQGMLGRGVTRDTENRERNAVIDGIYGNTVATVGPDGLAHYTPLLVGGKTVPNQTRVTYNDLFFSPAGGGASFATNGAFEYSVFDGTVYRLREISLAYNLPKQWYSKLKVSNINISLSGRNLWYFAPNVPKYTRFDPDMNSVLSSGTQGVETGGAPSSKRYGVNLNVTF